MNEDQNPTTRQEQLQDAIDKLLKNHKNEWYAPLPFHVEKVVGQSGSTILSIPGPCPDILMYLTESFRGCKVYFSPKEYNPSNGFALGGKSQNPTDWDRLLFDLSTVTMNNNTQQAEYEEVIFLQEGSICSNITEGEEATGFNRIRNDLSFLYSVSGEKVGSSYEIIIPHVKDVVKRINNGEFHDMTPNFLDAIRDIERKLNEREAREVGSSTTNEGQMVSCHVPTHKRRKTSHSRWGSSGN